MVDIVNSLSSIGANIDGAVRNPRETIGNAYNSTSNFAAGKIFDILVSEPVANFGLNRADIDESMMPLVQTGLQYARGGDSPVPDDFLSQPFTDKIDTGIKIAEETGALQMATSAFGDRVDGLVELAQSLSNFENSVFDDINALNNAIMENAGIEEAIKIPQILDGGELVPKPLEQYSDKKPLFGKSPREKEAKRRQKGKEPSEFITVGGELRDANEEEAQAFLREQINNAETILNDPIFAGAIATLPNLIPEGMTVGEFLQTPEAGLVTDQIKKRTGGMDMTAVYQALEGVSKEEIPQAIEAIRDTFNTLEALIDGEKEAFNQGIESLVSNNVNLVPEVYGPQAELASALVGTDAAATQKAIDNIQPKLEQAIVDAGSKVGLDTSNIATTIVDAGQDALAGQAMSEDTKTQLAKDGIGLAGQGIQNYIKDNPMIAMLLLSGLMGGGAMLTGGGVSGGLMGAIAGPLLLSALAPETFKGGVEQLTGATSGLAEGLSGIPILGDLAGAAGNNPLAALGVMAAVTGGIGAMNGGSMGDMLLPMMLLGGGGALAMGMDFSKTKAENLERASETIESITSGATNIINNMPNPAFSQQASGTSGSSGNPRSLDNKTTGTALTPGTLEVGTFD